MPFVPTYAIVIKDRTYVINFDEYTNLGTPCVAIYVKNSPTTYFTALEKCIFLQNIKKFIGNKIINFGNPSVNKNQFWSFVGHPCHFQSKGIFLRSDSLSAKYFSM